MSGRRDPFWDHVRKICTDRWICNYCKGEFSGRPRRIKAHLGKISGKGVEICSSPDLPEDVRRQAEEALGEQRSEPDSNKRQRRDTDSAVPERINFGDNNPPEAQQVSTQGDDSSCYITGTREENFNDSCENSTQEDVPSSSALPTFSGLQNQNYLTNLAQYLGGEDREGEAIVAQRGRNTISDLPLGGEDKSDHGLANTTSEGPLLGLLTTSNYFEVCNIPQPQLDSRREVPSSNPDHEVANEAQVHYTMSLGPAALPESDSHHRPTLAVGRKPIVTSFLNLLVPRLVGTTYRFYLDTIYRDLILKDDINGIGIYGMGGVGKTALALNLHGRLCINGDFEAVLWVTVPKDASMYELQEEIATELKVPGFLKDVKDARKRAAILWEQFLRRGKCTLFLDDVWKHFEIGEVGIPVGISGLKLILTTRSQSICCGMPCDRLFKIKPGFLSSEDCFTLFKIHLKGRFRDSWVTHNDFIRTGCCGYGLPLAVVAMARSIRRMRNGSDLHHAFKRLEAKEGPEYEVIEKHLIQSLKRSYDVLPPQMQENFLTVALPQGNGSRSIERMRKLLSDARKIDVSMIGVRQILEHLENSCLLEIMDDHVTIDNWVERTAVHIRNLLMSRSLSMNFRI